MSQVYGVPRASTRVLGYLCSQCSVCQCRGTAKRLPTTRVCASSVDPPVTFTASVPFSRTSPSPHVSPSIEVEGTLFTTAFLHQPVGVNQVGDVWVVNLVASRHMANIVELMYRYDTRPSPPNRSRIIHGDGFAEKVEFIGKINLTFLNKNETYSNNPL